MDPPNILDDILSNENTERQFNTSAPEKQIPTTFCIECEDMPAQLFCKGCNEIFCKVCFACIHRKGTRKDHVTEDINGGSIQEQQTQAKVVEKEEQEDESIEVDIPLVQGQVGDYFLNRAKYIPLRLTFEERKYLRLLEVCRNQH